MRIENRSKEKVSIFLEWRKIGTALYATIQYEEYQEGDGHSKNRGCVLRFKLTNEEAEQGLNAMMDKYHWSKYEVQL